MGNKNLAVITLTLATVVIIGTPGREAIAASISETASTDAWFSTSDFVNFTPQFNDVYLRTFGGEFNRSALEFSLAGLSASSIVSDAEFTVTSGGTAVAGGVFQFWGFSGNGSITSATALNETTLLGTTPTLAGSPVYSLNVTNFIQSLASSGATYAGILITLQNQGPSVFTGNDLVSINPASGEGAEIPNLSITYSPVPLPAAGWLMLSGLGYLGVSAQKRRAA